MRFGLFALGLALATPAMAADQFDLVCKDAKGRINSRLRIDLQNQEWCSGDCKKIDKIAQVTSGLITLVDEQSDSPRGRSNFRQINRITGEYVARYRDNGRTLWDDTEQCEPASFSGMSGSSAKF